MISPDGFLADLLGFCGKPAIDARSGAISTPWAALVGSPKPEYGRSQPVVISPLGDTRRAGHRAAQGTEAMAITPDDVGNIVTAFSTLAAAIGGAVIAVINLIKINQAATAAAAHDQKANARGEQLAVIAERVNGVTDKIAATAHAAGKAEGLLEAKAATPAPATPETGN